jgi:hypothetical protein
MTKSVSSHVLVAALITGRNDQQDGYEAIIALMPWENFCANVAEAKALA